MSGILTAIKRKERGIEDFTNYEKAAGLGGTWRDIAYPGLSCDVPFHTYAHCFELKDDCKSWYPDRNAKPALRPWSFDRFGEEMQKPDLGDFDLAA